MHEFGETREADEDSCTSYTRLGEGLLKVPAEIRSMTRLTRVCLHGNNITTVQYLDHLPALTEIILSSNNISSMRGLRKCTAVQVLNLSCNRIEVVEGLQHLTRLTQLQLAHNYIKTLSGFQALQGGCLQHLDLRDNHISGLQEFSHLAGLVSLHTLLLEGPKGTFTNPVTQLPQYRLAVEAALPHVQILDTQAAVHSHSSASVLRQLAAVTLRSYDEDTAGQQQQSGWKDRNSSSGIPQGVARRGPSSPEAAQKPSAQQRKDRGMPPLQQQQQHMAALSPLTNRQEYHGRQHGRGKKQAQHTGLHHLAAQQGSEQVYSRQLAKLRPPSVSTVVHHQDEHHVHVDIFKDMDVQKDGPSRRHQTEARQQSKYDQQRRHSHGDAALQGPPAEHHRIHRALSARSRSGAPCYVPYDCNGGGVFEETSPNAQLNLGKRPQDIPCWESGGYQQQPSAFAYESSAHVPAFADAAAWSVPAAVPKLVPCCQSSSQTDLYGRVLDEQQALMVALQEELTNVKADAKKKQGELQQQLVAETQRTGQQQLRLQEAATSGAALQQELAKARAEVARVTQELGAQKEAAQAAAEAAQTVETSLQQQLKIVQCELAAATSARQELQQQVDALQQANVALRQELSALRQEHSALQKQHMVQQEDHQRQRQAWEEDQAGLRGLNEALQADLHDISGQYASAQKQVSIQEQQLQQAQESLQLVRQEGDRKVALLHQEADAARGRAVAAAEEVGRLQRSLDNMVSSFAELNKRASDREEQLQRQLERQLEAEQERCRQRVAELEDELRAALQEGATEAAALQQQVHAAHREASLLQLANDKLRMERDRHAEATKEAKQKLDKAHAKVQVLAEEKTSLLQHVATFNPEETESLRSTVAALREKVGELQAVKDALTREQSLRAAAERQLQELKRVQQELQHTAGQQLAASEQLLARHQQEAARQVETLKQRLRSQEEALEGLEEELDRAQHALRVKEVMVDDAQDNVAGLKQRLHSLEEQLQDAAKQVEESESRRRKADTVYQDAMQGLREEIRSQEATIESLEAAGADAMAKADAATKQLQQLHEQLQEKSKLLSYVSEEVDRAKGMFEGKLQAAAEQTEQMQAQVHTATAQLEEAQDKLAALQLRCATLEGQLQDATTACQQAQRDAAAFREMAHESQQRAALCEKRTEEVEEELRELLLDMQAQRAAAREKVAELAAAFQLTKA